MIAFAEIDEAQEKEANQPKFGGVSFFDLEPGMCKFPLGALHDPPERFCGEPAPVGSPYCPRCRAIAYVPSRRA